MPIRGTINPYIVGPAITGEHGFYGRQDLVDEIVNTLTGTRHNIVVLHGPRRIGKSSLLHRLRRDQTLLQSHLPIIYDMQLYEKATLPRKLFNLTQDIADELGLEPQAVPTETDLANNPDLFHKKFLPDIFRHLDQRRLLILFDEADVETDFDPSGSVTDGDFLVYLRSLIAKDYEQIGFIFVVSQLYLLNEGYRRLFKGATAKPVGRMTQEETKNLLSDLAQQGQMSYTDEALLESWSLTNGHPYITQLIGYETFERLRKQGRDQAEVADITGCLAKAMEHIEAGLNWYWTGLSREEQLILMATAELSDRDKSVTDAEIGETLQRHLLFLTDADRRNTYTPLISGDYLIDTGGRRYKFAVEIIRRWIANYHPLKEAQRELEQSNPESLNYYQLGKFAFERGKFVDAITNYRLAIEHNPYFADAYLGLAPALVVNGEIDAAIEAYEKAYQLDPDGARDRLVDQRMERAGNLNETGDQEATLGQLKRVLEIKPDHSDARHMMGRIYLDQINGCLADHNFDKALSLVHELVAPVPIVQDSEVGPRVRTMWLAHSQALTRQTPPEWDEAQQVLESLTSIDLEDETVRSAINDNVLNKAQSQLADEALAAALDLLQPDKLKDPYPTEQVKRLLIGYSQQQIEKQDWLQADQALQGLLNLVKDEEGTSAQNGLYQRWGDALLAEKEFEQAIAIYEWGPAKTFKAKIVEAQLQKATAELALPNLPQARVSFERALNMQNTQPIRKKARAELENYFTQYRQSRAWPLAQETLDILLDLDLAGQDGETWQTGLQLEQAKDELEYGRLPEAFQIFTPLREKCTDQIKTLIGNYLYQILHKGEWAVGAEVLERLNSLLERDEQANWWQASWLYLWAKALYPKETPERRPNQAKVLCQKILTLGVKAPPLIDLTSPPETSGEEKTELLLPLVCVLAAEISLDQAQTQLDKDHLVEAQPFFEEALALPFPPDQLKRDIYDRLFAFSQSQSLKERPDKAQETLEMILALQVGDPSATMAVLKTIPLTQARLALKNDQPSDAFTILTPQLNDMSDEEKEAVKAMVYQFSRLYAGRNCWSTAKLALKNLQEWLTPQSEEIAELRDALNREHLNFIKGRRAPIEVPEIEIKRLTDEFEIAAEGYREAGALELATQQRWADDLIQVGLRLGLSHLDNDKMVNAIEIYRRILEVESETINHQAQISQGLHNYGERVLLAQNWALAKDTLGQLKQLNLVAPDGQTRPDPRVDGAIQRIIVAQAEDFLERDEVTETFAELETLPRPRPTGEVKQIMLAYSHNRRAKSKWKHATDALRYLDKFQSEDHPEARDQETLGELVNCLEQWGHFLEKNNNLAFAAEIYEEALEYTRQAAEPRHLELADQLIRVVLQLAQNKLANDPLKTDTPAVIAEALADYQKILALTEHNREHEQGINQALHAHSEKLAQVKQWERGHQLLDQLNALYHPQPEKEDKKQFASWRQTIVFDEINTWLERKNPEPAFQRLTMFKAWLNAYKAPEVTWSAAIPAVKQLVNGFCQPWLDAQQWELSTQTLARLAELISKDQEIISWQVLAFRDWGRWARQERKLKEAIERYEQALDKVPQQKIILADDLEPELLDTQLLYARQHLDRNDLTGAETIYKQILQKPSDYLGRADKIRQDLYEHSLNLTKPQSRPDWASAHQALNCLQQLKLDNPQVIEWRHSLTLKEMEAALHTHNLEAAFTILQGKMESPWPLDRIQNTLHEYCTICIQDGDTWPKAIETMKQFADTVQENGSRQWAIQELERIGDMLGEKGNSEGADKAYTFATGLKS